jgi:hypothetical protein
MKKSTTLEEAAHAFNEIYPIGTELFVVNDFGIEAKFKLLSKAWIIGNHSIIAKFEGIGTYDIKRVCHRMTYKENPLGIPYLVPADANGKAI